MPEDVVGEGWKYPGVGEGLMENPFRKRAGKKRKKGKKRVNGGSPLRRTVGFNQTFEM